MNRNFNYNYYPSNMDRDMSNPKFFTEKEGYLRGNMFRNLYSRYKNYEPQKSSGLFSYLLDKILEWLNK